MARYKLEDIFDLQMGKTPSRNNSEYWNTCDNKWISIGDLTQAGKYVTDTKEYLSDVAVEESGIKIIPANTVVMSFKLSIGKTAITSEDMYSNEAVMAFHDKQVVDLMPEYIYYMFKYKDWDEGTNKAVMGKTLNKATLSKVEIEVCPLEKQKEIVELLDKVSTVLDGRNEELKKLDELIKARFVELFGDLMENPLGWPVMTIADVSTFLKSGLSRKLSDDDIGLPVIRSGNIQDGQFIFDDVKYWYIDDPQGANTKDYILKDGDVLVNFINSSSQIGKTAIYRDTGRDCIYTTNIFRMKLADNCNEYYYNWFAMSDYYYRHLQSIIQPAVNQASFTTVNFLKLPIPLPPKEKQGKFADFVKQVDKSKVAVQKSLDETQKLFDSLMQEYFG